MFEMPKGDKLRWRTLAILLPASIAGAVLLNAVGFSWPDAAMVSTVSLAVGLVFLQRHYQLSRDASRAASPLASLFMSINLRPLNDEELADASRLDREFRRRWWLWLGLFASAVTVGGASIHAIAPGVEWRRAFTLSFTGCMALLVLVLAPWFGYRKWTRAPAWKTFAFVFGLMLVGLLAGLAAPNARPLAAIEQEKVLRAVAIALLVAVAFAGLIVGISQMRLREVTQQAARLAAEAESERLARQGAQAELKVLQAQVEPHFLFNTLANVRHLVQGGSADALPMLDHLIQYLRSALPEIRTESSTLGREARLAHSYLAIMRMRMGAGLDVSIDVPPELERSAFPPLMLLTLVENAVKHGVGPRSGGRIAVSAQRMGAMLRVTVHDDGAGLGGAIGQGVGLVNTRERLRALYGDAARLDLSSAEPGGTVAAIEIPFA